MNCIYRACIILVLFIFGSCKVLKLDKGKKDQRCCNDNITHHTVKAPMYGIGAMIDGLIDSVDCMALINVANYHTLPQSQVYNFNSQARHYISTNSEDGKFDPGFENENQIYIVYHPMANFDVCQQDPIFCGPQGLTVLIDSLTDHINHYEVFEYDFKFIGQLGNGIASGIMIEDWFNELVAVQQGQTYIMPNHAYMLGQLHGISPDNKLMPYDNKIHVVLMKSNLGMESFTFNPEDYNGYNSLFVQDNFIALSEEGLIDFDKFIHSLGHFFNLNDYPEGYRSTHNYMHPYTGGNHFNLAQRQAIRQSAIFQRNYLLNAKN